MSGVVPVKLDAFVDGGVATSIFVDFVAGVGAGLLFSAAGLLGRAN